MLSSLLQAVIKSANAAILNSRIACLNFVSIVFCLIKGFDTGLVIHERGSPPGLYGFSVSIQSPEHNISGVVCAESCALMM